MNLAGERIAAALGHGAHHSAERAAVLGRDPRRLDLNFLQVLELRVLARLSVHQGVCRNAVDRERILGAAGAVHLNAAFDLALVDRGRRDRDGLEGPRLRHPVELFLRHVVRALRAARIHEGDGGRDLHGLGLRGDRQATRQLEGRTEQHEHVLALDVAESCLAESQAIRQPNQARRRTGPSPIAQRECPSSPLLGQ